MKNIGFFKINIRGKRNCKSICISFMVGFFCSFYFDYFFDVVRNKLETLNNY